MRTAIACPPSGLVLPAQSGELKAVSVARGLANPWAVAFLPDGRFLVTERAGRLAHRRARRPSRSARRGAAGGGRGRPVRPARRGAGPEVRRQRLDLLELCRGRRRRQQHGGGARQAAGQPAERGAGHLPATAEGVEPSCTAARAWCSRAMVACSSCWAIASRARKTRRSSTTTSARWCASKPTARCPPTTPSSRRRRAAEIWSLGHRNMQGAALHPQTGELWATEHGPQGGDELNVVRAGKNYGWPLRDLRPQLRHRYAHRRGRPEAGLRAAAEVLGAAIGRAQRPGLPDERSLSRAGRAACSSARCAVRRWCAWSSTARACSRRSRC